MVFKGSLASGHLECPQCSQKPAAQAPVAADEPFSVRVARERMKGYEDYGHGVGSNNCPYCQRLNGHTDSNKCLEDYEDDEDFVTYYDIHGTALQKTPPYLTLSANQASQPPFMHISSIQSGQLKIGDYVNFSGYVYRIVNIDSHSTYVVVPFVQAHIVIAVPSANYQAQLHYGYIHDITSPGASQP